MAHLYRFRDVWAFDAPAERVMKALVDVGAYPSWWQDVRDVTRVDDDTAAVRCRALLPYSLELLLRRHEQNEPEGRLRIDLSGDLDGFCRARVRRHRERSVVTIEQEVVLRKQPLRRIEPVLRPMLRANHAVMMGRGRRGLRAYLA